jgi:ubiquinone/menaquinone biosynthesis C-methylase UbiE
VKRTHYSYAHYADSSVASGFDRLRFGGPIGELVAETQERVLLDFAGALDGAAALDVGTGTGRAAFILARAGARVTGLDASMEMLRVGRDRSRTAAAAVTFMRGDAHGLPFADKAFDLCVSFRVLMHTPGWRTCLQELCRLSRARVIVDYPSAASAASVQALARRLAQRLGRATEAYRVFSDATMDQAFAEAGFRVIRRHKDFLLPIALHKRIGSRQFTERAETAFARGGLVRLLGSPVTVLAERCTR